MVLAIGTWCEPFSIDVPRLPRFAVPYWNGHRRRLCSLICPQSPPGLGHIRRDYILHSKHVFVFFEYLDARPSVHM
jgi:hypothetical protein